jgi:hypothetical protein
MQTHTRTLRLTAALLVAVLGTGCAAYRTDSNIRQDSAAPALNANTSVLIAEDSLPGRKYKALGLVEVSVKKLTVFHADPTRKQANDALSERARLIGADAVINVTYKSGIGWMTWGYIDASGTGVKLQSE